MNNIWTACPSKYPSQLAQTCKLSDRHKFSTKTNDNIIGQGKVV